MASDARPEAMTSVGALDPLLVLREYGQLAPWNLRDLSTLAGAMLDASGITPINAAARAKPSERTIRFYVTKGLVSAPDGRGTAATYSYRHLLQVLAIKLRQMEGTTLASIRKELQDSTGDVLERRVATALGAALPRPDRLRLQAPDALPRGKSGRALSGWLARTDQEGATRATTWRRVPVARGIELHIDAEHPLARLGPDDGVVGDAVRNALGRLVPDIPA